MKPVSEHVDVLVAGGGTAGHVAAIQAARAGVTTAVIEAGSMLGGTMTEGGVYMPNHFFSTEDFAIFDKHCHRFLGTGTVFSLVHPFFFVGKFHILSSSFVFKNED